MRQNKDYMAENGGGRNRGQVEENVAQNLVTPSWWLWLYLAKWGAIGVK